MQETGTTGIGQQAIQWKIAGCMRQQRNRHICLTIDKTAPKSTKSRQKMSNKIAQTKLHQNTC